MEWIEITDPQTQNTFYANPTTGECQWDKPNIGRVKPKDPAGEWWELYDDNHKLPYYYNTVSGQTEWLRPASGTVIPLVSIQNSALGKRVSVALQRNSASIESWKEENSPGDASFERAGAPEIQEDESQTQRTANADIVINNSIAALVSSYHPASGAENPVRHSGAWGQPKVGADSPSYFNASVAVAPETPRSTLTPVNKSAAAADNAKSLGIGPPQLNREAAVKMSPVNNHTGGSSEPTITTDNRSSLKSLPPELQNDISQFQIDGFAKKYFSTHKHGIFRRKVPMEKLLNWSKESLKLPLIVLNKPVHKDALKCFKTLQKVMGDRSRTKAESEIEDVQWILNKGILHGELRDEIYVQLCKQLTQNPSSSSVNKGWELMCVILTAFPPSKNFEHYLKSFLRQHEDDSDVTVATLAKYAVTRLKRVCKVGPRGKVLTAAEIDRAKEAAFKPSVFGECLEDIMKVQREKYPDLCLPRILPFLAESILKLDGQKAEGIFRVPGDADEVTELKVRLENGRYDLTGITDPNVPSSLLKFWLRDLAEPLVPENFYADCLRFAEDAPRAVAIINQLPEVNKRVVHYVINFLQLFAKPDTISVTKMNVANLGMVMAPNFLRCPSENLALVFENTKFEQAFMRTLILSLRNDPAEMRL